MFKIQLVINLAKTKESRYILLSIVLLQMKFYHDIPKAKNYQYYLAGIVPTNLRFLKREKPQLKSHATLKGKQWKKVWNCLIEKYAM